MSAISLHPLPTKVPWIPQPLLGIDETVRFPIFRYTQEKYFNHLLIAGDIRLGALAKYRDEEALGSEVGDQSEGVRHIGPAHPSSRSLSLPLFFYGDAINCWTMCCTQEQDQRFYKEFGADCCLRIDSPEFFIAIAAALADKAWCGSLVAVEYLDDHELGEREIQRQLNGSVEPQTMMNHIKPRRYAWQNEVRLLMEPWSPAPLEQAPPPDLQQRYFREGPTALLQRPRLFPNLNAVIVHAPDARPFIRLVERA